MRLHWTGIDGWDIDREIGPASLTIGRSSSCDIVLPHSRVSRRHARIDTHGDGTVTIRDLGSRNGVIVNGSRTTESFLKPGDDVTIGPVTLHVVTQAGDIPHRDVTPTAAPEMGRVQPGTPTPAAAPSPVFPLPAPTHIAEAERAYRQAIAAGHTNAHNHLGLLLQSQGDVAGAADEYRRALEAGHGAAAYNLSNLLSQQGDAGGSQRMLERARAVPVSAPSVSLPMPPIAPVARATPEQLQVAAAPRKHRARIWWAASGGVVLGMALLLAAAHALQPQALCRKNCPLPPPPKSPALAYPTTYRSAKYGFTVAYDKALQPFRVTGSLIAWGLRGNQGNFNPSVSGMPSGGRSADNIVADTARAHFPQFSFQYRIPAAEVGYIPGAGAVYAGTWTPLQGQSVAARVAIVAAVRNNVAIVLECEGNQVSESGALHPDPSALAGDAWCDQTLNTIQWPGQRPL